MTGHLFIVHGDLTTIACDAILVPTDEGFSLTESWDSLQLEKPRGGWGGASVIHYCDTAGGPQIWLGNIGRPGNDNGFDVFEPAVREFVALAKAAVRRSRRNPSDYWSKPRLALNVIGSGHGGGKERAGDLILGIVRLLRSMARRHHVDIVLATFGDRQYAGAQRARRQLLREDSHGEDLTVDDLTRDWQFADFTPKDLPAKAKELAKAAIDSRLVLFIGAGVSAGAGIPTWKTLLRTIAGEAGIDDAYLGLLKNRDLRDWATLIDRKLTIDNNIREAAASVIKQYSRCSLQHALLASLPSTEAVTTNFDQLFEVSSRVADHELAVLPTHPQGRGVSWLLKLHGSVDKYDDMVPTRSDFLDMPRSRGALMGLVQGLLLTRHMLYVGYSLSDEDFQELIHEVRTARGTSAAAGATMLTLAADQVQRDLWSDDLDIIAMIDSDSDKKVTDAKKARELEIFLDLVGFLSTTSAAFFLDPAYSSLSKDESELRGHLKDLERTVRQPGPDAVASIVKNLLHGLGVNRTAASARFTERITFADLDAGRIRFPEKSAELLPEAVTTVEVELRATTLNGTWDPKSRRHRCATLTLDDPSKMKSLVGVGERLTVPNRKARKIKLT